MADGLEEVGVIDVDAEVPSESAPSESSSALPCLCTDYPYPSGTPLLVSEICNVAASAVEAAKSAGQASLLTSRVLCSVRVTGLLEEAGDKTIIDSRVHSPKVLRCGVDPKAFLLISLEGVHPFPELQFLSKFQFIGELVVVQVQAEDVASLVSVLEASASQQTNLRERLLETTITDLSDASLRRTDFSSDKAIPSLFSQSEGRVWLPLVRARVVRHLPSFDFQLYRQALKLLRCIENHTTPEAVSALAVRNAKGESDLCEDEEFA